MNLNPDKCITLTPVADLRHLISIRDKYLSKIDPKTSGKWTHPPGYNTTWTHTHGNTTSRQYRGVGRWSSQGGTIYLESITKIENATLAEYDFGSEVLIFKQPNVFKWYIQ